jgi:membrane protease subunit HflK
MAEQDPQRNPPTPTDAYAHRNLEVFEAATDAANKALGDALRISFLILKVIMVVIVILYLFTNVRCIESSEQALVTRLGRLRPRVFDAGLAWAYPYPLEEITLLPTRASNESEILTHNFNIKEQDRGKDLAVLASRANPRGLDPALDGALLTADSGLVHVQWRITYKFDDVRDYVLNIRGDKVESAKDLIDRIVETTGVQIASEMTAEEIIRTRVSDVQDEMKLRTNERLASLNSGLRVTLVEMNQPTPPLQIRDAFIATQREENAKQKAIRDAERDRTKMLNDAAGAAHEELLALLDRIDVARAANDQEKLTPLEAELDDMLMRRVEGKAGEMIRNAGAIYPRMVGQIKSDVELYRTLIPEFERNADLLIERLWETTRREILLNDSIVKVFRPTPLGQIRVHIERDPEQRRIDEAKQLQKKEFDASSLSPGRLVPVGPEYD